MKVIVTRYAATCRSSWKRLRSLDIRSAASLCWRCDRVSSIHENDAWWLSTLGKVASSIMTREPPGEVTVVNGDRWTARLAQLAELLAGSVPGRVISDPDGLPADPEHLVGLSDPGYWAADPRALGDALADLAGKPRREARGQERAAGAIAPGTERLTLTVEEAAATLGISRAFAYEAVSRGEIPSIRIGRRVLVPRAALERMLGGAD